MQAMRRNAPDSGKCANGVQPLSYINKNPPAEPGVFHMTGVALCYWPRVTSRKYGLTPAWRLLLATRKRVF